MSHSIRMYLRLSLMLIFATFHFLCLPQFLPNIDKTWQILPEEYKQYSLTWGAIGWETGLMDNMYRFGNIYPIETKDRRDRTVITYDPEKSDATIKLLYTLFYRVPGSTSPSDFNVTDFMISDPQKIAELGARLMAGLENLQEQLEIDHAQKALEQITQLRDNPELQKNKQALTALNTLEKELEQLQITGNTTKIAHFIQQQFVTGQKTTKQNP